MLLRLQAMQYAMPNLRPILVLYYTPQWFSAFALCLQLAVAFACVHPNKKDYFPLTVGARWTYSGRISSSKEQFDVPASIHIEGETAIRGRRYFKYVIKSDLSAVTKPPRRLEEVRYYRVAQDGIYFLPGKDIEGDELLEMPLPIQTGVSWPNGTSEVSAESVGTVKASKREYEDCLKITYRGAGSVKRTEYYLAPSIGVVKAVYVDVIGPGSNLELILEKYEP